MTRNPRIATSRVSVGRALLGALIPLLSAGQFLLGCSDPPEDTPSIDDFLPEVAEPTGADRSTWAGPITPDQSAELIPGPAASGMVGDFYMRNARARFVVQAPTRVIGVVANGGNLVDVVPLAADGTDLAADHFGELSFIYLLGRTCDHTEVEVIRDGSGGGAAVIRARGVTQANDFVNLRGIGLFNVPVEIDPAIEDGATCATTYTLEPDADYLRVQWTLFNSDEDPIRGPTALMNDIGGETAAFSPTRGFDRLGIDGLDTLDDPVPIEYTLYQGPGVAYGALPRHQDPDMRNAALLVSGVSVFLFRAEKLVHLLDADNFYLDLPGQTGHTVEVHIAVGRDAADIEEIFRTHASTGEDRELGEIAGQVAWSGGSPATSARVGVFRDDDADGAIGPDDAVLWYMDTDATGAFSGTVPTGNYLLRAEVENIARSPGQTVALPAEGATDLSFALDPPVYFDYRITDDTGTPIPGRLTVIGRHPVAPDSRLFDTDDRASGTVLTVHSRFGTTVDIGDGADETLALPAGATYRILASRGTEWSVADQVVTVEAGAPGSELVFELARVAPADGYVASEFHVHQIGSMDSPVSNERRVASMLAEGVELFASTDHDYVSDLQPVIEAMGVADKVRNIAGLEVTPFAYGHFNAWPIAPLDTSPNRGAIDWSRGMEGYNMIPGEIFTAMRERGAEMVQVNHPRSTLGGIGFLMYFDRAGLRFDYDSRQIVGDLASAPIPNDWLRLPGVSLWDNTFNAVEIWMSFSVGDSNDDGVRELVNSDLVLRDWFNFLTLGHVVTPTASSDTHAAYSKPAGMPRTYVRVGDDSPAAVESGAIVADSLATMTGQMSRDVVLTNGPHIQVTLAGQSQSALGATIDAAVDGTAGEVTFEISVHSPEWAHFDTLEVFVNSTPDLDADASALQPLYCYTSRDPADLSAADVCAQTPDGPRPLAVQVVPVTGTANRLEAGATLTVNPADIVNHANSTGQDAWLVVRVRGDRAIFPLLSYNVIDDDSIDILVSGTPEQRTAALTGVGAMAMALTAPVFIDFDGGGYTAALSPQ